MELNEKIKLLTRAYGVSGDEFAVSKIAAELMAPYVDRVEIDDFGNVTGYRSCGVPGAKKLLLDAHLDEIGIDSDLDTELLRKYARDIYDLIRYTALPYHPTGVTSIYYNPEGGQLELIYNVDGIQYHFLVNCPQAEHSGTPAIAYGRRFGDVYFAMYESGDKLYADFTASGKTMALRISTDDPEKVDFTSFAIRNIAY